MKNILDKGSVKQLLWPLCFGFPPKSGKDLSHVNLEDRAGTNALFYNESQERSTRALEHVGMKERNDIWCLCHGFTLWLDFKFSRLGT